MVPAATATYARLLEEAEIRRQRADDKLLQAMAPEPEIEAIPDLGDRLDPCDSGRYGDARA